MVCATCKGLQKHLKTGDGADEAETVAQQLVDASLAELRASAASCRACALLLQGLLLHHERFRGVKEDGIRITAESFTSLSPGQNSQDHLSVEARWKTHDDGDEQEDNEDEQELVGWPNLKLEFFTDGGRFALPNKRVR